MGFNVAQWIGLGEDGRVMNESCNSLEQESRKHEISSWEKLKAL